MPLTLVSVLNDPIDKNFRCLLENQEVVSPLLLRLQTLLLPTDVPLLLGPAQLHMHPRWRGISNQDVVNMGHQSISHPFSRGQNLVQSGR